MHEQELELSIGDSVLVGEYLVTVIDIEGTEISVRIESEQDQEIRVDELHLVLPR